MRFTTIFATALLLRVSNAYGEYSGPWNYSWGFGTGTQGWTIHGSTGRWIGSDEPNGPVLPDGSPSGGGYGNLYLPDTTWAELDVSWMHLGGGIEATNKTNPFVFQADFYIPNLSPLTFGGSESSNQIYNAGIAAWRTDNKGPYVKGYSPGNEGIISGDNSWYGTSFRKSWIFTEASLPAVQTYDNWYSIQIDYSYTSPGFWAMSYYIPYDNAIGKAGWVTYVSGKEVNPGSAFTRLIVGSLGNSWTQAQWDNARIAFVPEPGSLAVLGTGVAGLLSLARSRRGHR
ncbi:MAG: PEP-CTERM sorting domain-containing protein [Armatimonadota bacterium]